MMKSLIAIFIFSLSAISCVGKVEDGNKNKAYSVSRTDTEVVFSGIEEVKAISDDKLELYWKPATGGSQKYNYIVFYGGAKYPAVIPSDVLTPDYRGLLKYTLIDLLPGYNYKIKVDVDDQSTGYRTVTSTIKEDETFFNDVADFSGIGSVSNLPGVAGIDSIKVEWPHAAVLSDGLLKEPDSDPKQYEITAMDASLYTPADFDNVGLNGNIGRFVEYVTYNETINEVVMRGLPQGTDFWVRVRCIHKGSQEDISKPYLRSELNTNYLKISTLTNDLASIQYDQSEIEIVPGIGADAAKTFTVKWGQMIGVFDHYRIYYSQSSIVVNNECNINLPNGAVYCKKVDYTSNQAIVYPLDKEATYNIWFVICADAICSQNLVAKTWSYSTSLAKAPFLGAEDITFATKLDELGEVTVHFTPPNLLQGYFDGFVVTHKIGSGGTPVDITDPAYGGNPGEDLIVQLHDHQTAAQLTIENVPYNVNNCFNIQVFTYLTDGSRNIDPNTRWVCKTPIVQPPTSAEFIGFSQVQINSNKINTTVSMSWPTPSKGVFSKYDIFLMHTGNNFNFTDAITDSLNNVTANYFSYSLSGGTNNFTLNFVPEGKIILGILSRHDDTNATFRSEYNTQIYECDVPAAPLDNSSVLLDCTIF